MKAFVSQQAFYFAIAVALVGGSGWVLYSQWFAAETDKVQTENDGETGVATQETVLPESELSVAAPDAADFDRLATGSQLESVSPDPVISGSGGDFPLGDSPTISIGDGGDSDSFVINDSSTVRLDNGQEFDLGGGDFVPTEPALESELSSGDPLPGALESGTLTPPEPGLLAESTDFPLPETPLILANDDSVNLPATSGDLNTTNTPSDHAGTRLPEENSVNPLQPLSMLPVLDTTGAVETVGDVHAGSMQNMPGNLTMEGIQLPSLSIEKVAPEEVQVNRPAVFTTRIKNNGKITALGIRVTDYVPRGTRLESAHPEFIRAADGSIQWDLEALEPGEEVTVSMKVTPLAEGEIGSVATVSFAARASVRTVSTKPQLTIRQTFDETVLIGETVLVNIVVSNPGSGDATGIVIEADIPPELSHAAGNELEYQIGTLRPGQSKQLSLRLQAERAGIVQNVLTVRGKGQIENRSVKPMRIVAPDLQVSLNGPGIRYLDRQTIYSVDVANPGTASARNVELVAYLPKGLKFVSTDHHGAYDRTEHAVFWKLEELPPQIRDSVKLTAIAVEPGEQKVRLEGTANLGVQAEFEHIVKVESVPELEFSVKDTADPIEIGSDTTYDVKVVNLGTRTATGVRISAAFPPTLRPIQGGGPTDVRIEGQIALFAPLDRLAPGAEAVFRIKAKALAVGDTVIRVQITSDDKINPVTKEESTRVYSDN